MNCHACSAPMELDHHGHPIHDGPCPGYPIPWTSRTEPCPNCGHDVLAKTMRTHHKKCTPEHPQPPVVGKDRCRTCALHHRPKCQPLPARWPAAPFLAALWTRLPEPTYEAAEAITGIHASTWPRAGDELSDEQADRWACRIGLHPSLIWQDWFEAALDPLLHLLMAGGWRTAWLHDNDLTQEIPHSDQEAAA